MKSAVRILILMVGVAALAAPMFAEDGGPIPLHPPKAVTVVNATFEDGGPIPLHPPRVVAAASPTFEDGGPIPLHPPR